MSKQSLLYISSFQKLTVQEICVAGSLSGIGSAGTFIVREFDSVATHAQETRLIRIIEEIQMENVQDVTC